MIERKLAAELAAGAKSLLILGPRQTGKSTLLARLFPEALTINLIRSNSAELLDEVGEEHLVVRPKLASYLRLLGPHKDFGRTSETQG
jgi:predicted AAA+ superfamily ATPase